jgi:BASS family bile acid:Na+ symporter
MTTPATGGRSRIPHDKETAMEVTELLGALFNVSLILMIVATMVSAGFTTTFAAIGSVLSRWSLVLMVLVTALVLRPLVGWGLAELFNLDNPAFIAMVLAASVAGAPLGVKFVMGANADLTTGAVLQVMLAVVASFTFAPTANFIIEQAELGDDVSLPVADLIKTIVFLQVLPFVVGLLIRHWNEKSAAEWNEFAKKVSGPTFLIVIVLALLGSFQTIIDLLGDRVLIAGVIFPAVMIALGYFISTGDYETRAATALIEPGSNSGPAFAAVAIAFNNDPEILGVLTVLIFLQIIVAAPVGTWMGSKFGPEVEEGDESGGAEAPAEAGA